MTNSDIHEAETLPPPPPSKPRGFAAMTQEKRSEISSMGGASVRAEQRNFSRNRELAREAGRKGGKASAKSRRVKP